MLKTNYDLAISAIESFCNKHLQHTKLNVHGYSEEYVDKEISDITDTQSLAIAATSIGFDIATSLERIANAQERLADTSEKMLAYIREKDEPENEPTQDNSQVEMHLRQP